MTPRSGYSWDKLNALAVAIEAAAEREPYPRLARLMQDLAVQDRAAPGLGARPPSLQPTYG